METDTTPRNGTGPILFAYDGSEEAKNAIREAGRQLVGGRKAIVLTVWQPLAAVPFAGIASAPDVEAGIEAEARTVAEEGARLAGSVGFTATAIAQDGSPTWNSIVIAADEHEAGLVVMGSHGRTGLDFVLMGSVAAAVARHSDRPVLIVHAPKPAQAA